MTAVVLKTRIQDSRISLINFSQSPENHLGLSFLAQLHGIGFPKHYPHIPRFAIIDVLSFRLGGVSAGKDDADGPQSVIMIILFLALAKAENAFIYRVL
jgi:hypothetical protein